MGHRKTRKVPSRRGKGLRALEKNWINARKTYRAAWATIMNAAEKADGKNENTKEYRRWNALMGGWHEIADKTRDARNAAIKMGSKLVSTVTRAEKERNMMKTIMAKMAAEEAAEAARKAGATEHNVMTAAVPSCPYFMQIQIQL